MIFLGAFEARVEDDIGNASTYLDEMATVEAVVCRWRQVCWLEAEAAAACGGAVGAECAVVAAAC